MIELKNVYKIFENDAVALDGVSFSIEDGEFVFIVGSSGGGKSSIMRSLLREISVDEGSIVVNGYDLRKITHKELPYYRRGLGVVFQDFRLLKDKTVYENVAFAMEVVGASQKEIKRRVPPILAMVGLTRKSESFPDQLSGGERQRCALARAIVNRPPILLADEPTGNLDPDTAWEIMKLLEEINHYGTTVVIATHAKDIVDAMQKRVIGLKRGKIVRDTYTGGYDYEQ